MTNETTNILLIAVGSAHGDDRAAWDVADLLIHQGPGGIRVRKASAPLDLLNWLDGVTCLHIVDACTSNEAPGTLLRIESPEFNHRRCESMRRPLGSQPSSGHKLAGVQMPEFRCTGTHDFDVLSVLELADRLQRLPPDVTIWGIVGQAFDPTNSISPEVGRRIPEIAEEILTRAWPLTRRRAFARKRSAVASNRSARCAEVPESGEASAYDDSS